MSGRVECIGLSLELASELRRLARDSEWQFVNLTTGDWYPVIPPRGQRGLAMILASLERADPQQCVQLLALPGRLWRTPLLCPVIMLGSAAIGEAAWQAGVTDFIKVPASPTEVFQRLEAVGRRVSGLHSLWNQFQRACGRLDRLSPRERFVLERLTDGWWIKKIAAELGTSPNTVRNQRAAIREKLAVHSEAEMFAFVHAARWFQAVCVYLARDDPSGDPDPQLDDSANPLPHLDPFPNRNRNFHPRHPGSR